MSDTKYPDVVNPFRRSAGSEWLRRDPPMPDTVPLHRATRQVSIIRGWKLIADHLSITPRAAINRANRDIDPLPVYESHRGPWAYAEHLTQWVTRQDVPYSVAVLKRPPGRVKRHPPTMYACGGLSFVTKKAKAASSIRT